MKARRTSPARVSAPKKPVPRAYKVTVKVKPDADLYAVDKKMAEIVESNLIELLPRWSWATQKSRLPLRLRFANSRKPGDHIPAARPELDVQFRLPHTKSGSTLVFDWPQTLRFEPHPMTFVILAAVAHFYAENTLGEEQSADDSLFETVGSQGVLLFMRELKRSRDFDRFPRAGRMELEAEARRYSNLAYAIDLDTLRDKDCDLALRSLMN